MNDRLYSRCCALNSGTSGLAASTSFVNASTQYSRRMPILSTYPSIAAFWRCLAPVIAAFFKQRAPLLSCGDHAFHTQPPSRWAPQPPAHTHHASMSESKTVPSPRQFHHWGKGTYMDVALAVLVVFMACAVNKRCGEQEEGECEMHRICNLCLEKKQKGSGGSTNQPKR